METVPPTADAAPAAEESLPPTTEETLPSTETVRSLIMNNWADALAIHYARQLYGADSYLFGPYLAALHDSVDWPTNQIDGATAFFRADAPLEDASPGDATSQPSPGDGERPQRCASDGEVPGDDVAAGEAPEHSYPSAMCFDDGGVMHVEYLQESEYGLPIQVEKSYAMTPEQPFVVVRYTLANDAPEGGPDVQVRLTEIVDLNNKAAPDYEESADDLTGTGLNLPEEGQPIEDIRAEWNSELNAWIADMSASNGTFLVFGAFQEMNRHSAFETAGDDVELDAAVEPETEIIDQDELAPGVDALAAADLGLSMSADVTVGADGSGDYAFFYGVAPSMAEAEEVARQAREPETPQFWFEQTGEAYGTWLQEGQQPDPPDPGLRDAYDRALITAKQSQQPEFGTWVAATNPAYGFKAWARDSSVTAMGLTAAGHPAEAAKYYRWMASVQEDGSRNEALPSGTWFTTYSYWLRDRPISFVEPEHDAIGLFMIGVLRTWQALNEQDPEAATEFLTGALESGEGGPASVYEAVVRGAEFIVDNIDEHDFGPADFSIWEEQLQRATFTQVTYASGLNAARILAEERGETENAAAWLEGARRIDGALRRAASSEPCPGLWNEAEGRWNRGTMPDCSTDDRLDASTDLTWVFGLVAADDERSLTQREQVLSELTPGEDDIGVARYEGDRFYYDSEFAPGGQFEASAAMPSWPQMDMYLSMLEHWTGSDDVALERLTWYVQVTNAGHMPPGEAVDWQTDLPLPSTSSEPVTGAWYVLGLLNFLDLFDPRLPALGSTANADVTAASTPPPADALAPRRGAARVYPLAARFAPGEPVAIRAEALSPTDEPLEGPLELTVFHLDAAVHRATSDPVTLQPDTPTTVEFTWTPPSTDFTGYLAVVSAGDQVIGSTGIDVSSTSLAYPRYGYLSDFGPDQPRDALDARVQRLAQDYHQNMFQFYDWFWRHEKLIERENGAVRSSWQDLFGRTNSVPVIGDLIDSAHRYNALAMAYVMIYAGREEYAERWPIDPAWGMFETPQATGQLVLDFSALAAGTSLFLFDPSNPGWQAWMATEYADAIETFAFDGVHIDQVGPRYGIFRADGVPLELPGAFASFLAATDASLSESDPERAACAFNIVDGTVDGWAVPEVATSEACDFLYSEIWFKTNTYAALQRYVEQLREIGRGRPVVLATYPQYGEQIGPVYEAEGRTRLEGAGTARNELGYTGFGFVDSFDNQGDSITWSVTLPESSTESLVFRYANASGHAVTAMVYVNDGFAGEVSFTSREEWSAWATDVYLQAGLEEGANSITLRLEDDTEGAVLIDHLNLGQFDEDAVRLQLAALFASGATPIIIGDDEQSLAHEYYPNRSKALPPPLKRALRDSYSFITAYETLLFPPEVVPYDDGAERLVATNGHRLIDEGSDGIWVVPRRIGPYDTFHLMNLVGVDDSWRNAAEPPAAQTEIGLRYYVGDDAIEAVHLASPDLDFGTSTSLPHTSGEDERGRYVEFTVPRLNYWDMVYVTRGE